MTTEPPDAAPRSRPIALPAPMVRAILRGEKTQHRVPVRNTLGVCPGCFAAGVPHNRGGLVGPDGSPNVAGAIFGVEPYLRVSACPHFDPMNERTGGRIRCHLGGVGDQLVVKETYSLPSGLDGKSPREVTEACLDANYPRPWSPIRYEADGRTENRQSLGDFGGGWGKIRASTTMPRWASRLTLEITDVRVQRLQDITEDDAIAEGSRIPIGEFKPRLQASRSERQAFARIWDATIGRRDGLAWAGNGWVWAITFRRLEAAI